MIISLRKTAVVITAFLFATLAGCGTADNSKNENSNGGGSGEEMNISIHKITDLQYQLSIQNNQEKEEKITFPSSQDFDYFIKDKDGTIVYTYSADKMFAATVEEEILAPGEKLEYELNLSEALSFLEPGDYTLEAWITATEIDENKVETDFSYEG